MSALNKIKDSTRSVEQAVVGASFEAIWGVATSHAPFLLWPVIKQVARFALEHTLLWLSNEGIIWFNTVWIKVQVSDEWSDVEDVRQMLILASDQGADDYEIDQLDRELIEAFKKAHRIGRNPL